jgi:ABC-type transport system involved in Fe-S cluster assembly fused permease/ATPase subunit
MVNRTTVIIAHRLSTVKSAELLIQYQRCIMDNLCCIMDNL